MNHNFAYESNDEHQFLHWEESPFMDLDANLSNGGLVGALPPRDPVYQCYGPPLDLNNGFKDPLFMDPATQDPVFDARPPSRPSLRSPTHAFTPATRSHRQPSYGRQASYGASEVAQGVSYDSTLDSPSVAVSTFFSPHSSAPSSGASSPRRTEEGLETAMDEVAQEQPDQTSARSLRRRKKQPVRSCRADRSSSPPAPKRDLMQELLGDWEPEDENEGHYSSERERSKISARRYRQRRKKYVDALEQRIFELERVAAAHEANAKALSTQKGQIQERLQVAEQQLARFGFGAAGPFQG